MSFTAVIWIPRTDTISSNNKQKTKRINNCVYKIENNWRLKIKKQKQSKKEFLTKETDKLLEIYF